MYSCYIIFGYDILWNENPLKNIFNGISFLPNVIILGATPWLSIVEELLESSITLQSFFLSSSFKNFSHLFIILSSSWMHYKRNSILKNSHWGLESSSIANIPRESLFLFPSDDSSFPRIPCNKISNVIGFCDVFLGAKEALDWFISPCKHVG